MYMCSLAMPLLLLEEGSGDTAIENVVCLPLYVKGHGKTSTCVEQLYTV